MRFQLQDLPSFPMGIAYAREESVFKKNAKLVSISKVPKTANIITSHVIDKLKISDDTSYKLKKRTAPHGSKEREKAKLKTDSSTCPPTGIRTVLSLATCHSAAHPRLISKALFFGLEEQRETYMLYLLVRVTNKKFYGDY